MATEQWKENFRKNNETIARGEYDEDDDEAEDTYPCLECNKKTFWKELYVNGDICNQCARGE